MVDTLALWITLANRSCCGAVADLGSSRWPAGPRGGDKSGRPGCGCGCRGDKIGCGSGCGRVCCGGLEGGPDDDGAGCGWGSAAAAAAADDDEEDVAAAGGGRRAASAAPELDSGFVPAPAVEEAAAAAGWPRTPGLEARSCFISSSSCMMRSPSWRLVRLICASSAERR
jgi:hypothetical protein